MTAHQCSMSLQCKSKDCCHAKPHAPRDCDRTAPCGCWPGNNRFQPMVKCVPVEQVKPRDDCPDCGAKEAAGHHPMDCIAVLKHKLANLKTATRTEQPPKL